VRSEVTQRRATKFWIESWVAAASGFLCVLTLIRKDWIEWLFGVDPDRGSGALEWAIVGGLIALAVVSALLARREWRHVSMLPGQR
jgi:hypothetical protein